MGVPICVDECTTRPLRVSFARMLVQVDVTQELPKSVAVDGSFRNIFEQPVLFEWAPLFYKNCRMIEHNCLAKKFYRL